MTGRLGLAYEIVDGDGHIVLPGDEWWKPYLPEKYWDWPAKEVVEPDGTRTLWAEGRQLEGPFSPVANYPAAGGSGFGVTPLSVSKGRQDAPISVARKLGGADPRDRLTAMDQDGVDVAYLFPSQVLSLIPALYSSSFADAMVRAYNDWIGDFCAADPHRLRPIAMLPQQDLILAEEEMRRVRKKSFPAVMLRPNTVGNLNLDHPNYERIWAAAVELDLTVCIHEGFGLKIPQIGVERCSSSFQGHVVSHAFEHMMTCLLMITSGVTERHPTLRIGFMESGAGWAPFWLDRMDEHFEKAVFNSAHPDLKRKPSDYFKRQCFLGVEPDYALLPQMVDWGLEDTLVYASDFPHFDCIFPGSAAAAANRTDMSGEVKRKLVRDNALRLFNAQS